VAPETVEIRVKAGESILVENNRGFRRIGCHLLVLLGQTLLDGFEERFSRIALHYSLRDYRFNGRFKALLHYPGGRVH
jgi:hypothetical protein